MKLPNILILAYQFLNPTLSFFVCSLLTVYILLVPWPLSHKHVAFFPRGGDGGGGGWGLTYALMTCEVDEKRSVHTRF